MGGLRDSEFFIAWLGFIVVTCCRGWWWRDAMRRDGRAQKVSSAIVGCWGTADNQIGWHRLRPLLSFQYIRRWITKNQLRSQHDSKRSIERRSRTTPSSSKYYCSSESGTEGKANCPRRVKSRRRRKLRVRHEWNNLERLKVRSRRAKARELERHGSSCIATIH